MGDTDKKLSQESDIQSERLNNLLKSLSKCKIVSTYLSIINSAEMLIL